VDLLLVVALVGVIAGMAVPVTGSAVAGQRFKGSAQALTQMVGLAKMRASASFTRARVRVNIDTNSFLLERWDKTANAWVAEGDSTTMASGVTFGFAGLAQPPPNTQGTIGLSPACRTGTTAATPLINNTACIIFNSRGLPVDGTGALFGGHALYLTDGISVSATTVTATPRIRRWSSWARAVNWREQL
jgi:Tfp pilus assembly protein FimT